MWFKQIQYFKMKPGLSFDDHRLNAALEDLCFEPCLPSLPISMGFVCPQENIDEPLVHAVNGYFMLCLQVEEKILPATVVRQTLLDRIKTIEQSQGRKVPYKEKQALQADIYASLLPRAFSRFKRLYAYVDTHTQALILNAAHPKDIGYFLNSWKKVLPDQQLITPDLKDLDYLLTNWLQHQSYPQAFAIEKACVLQDPQQQGRSIRAQQQNLSASAIQSLLTDGCQVKQLALTWQDRVSFNLNTEFSVKSLTFQDKLQAREEQEDDDAFLQFNTDFMLMTQAISELMRDLLAVCSKNETTANTSALATVHE